MSTATACACERSSEQRHTATSPARVPAPSSARMAPGESSTALAASQTGCAQRLLPVSSIVCASSDRKLRILAAAAPRKRRTAAD
jgi:hypothetical protein